MPTFPQPYVGYADCASRSTHKLSSVTWAIYAPANKLVSLQGICISLTTINIVEYNGVIKLLSDSILCNISHFVVKLDSQLIALHLNNVYSARSPKMLQMFLRIHILEIHFDHNKYQCVPRFINTLTYALVNYILDRYLQHL